MDIFSTEIAFSTIYPPLPTFTSLVAVIQSRSNGQANHQASPCKNDHVADYEPDDPSENQTQCKAYSGVTYSLFRCLIVVSRHLLFSLFNVSHRFAWWADKGGQLNRGPPLQLFIRKLFFRFLHHCYLVQGQVHPVQAI